MDDGAVSVIALLGFVGLVLVVLSVAHYYIWRRAVRATTLPGSRGRRVGTWLVVLALLSTVGAQIGGYLVPLDVVAPLAWVGYSWLGFAFYLFLFLVLGELVRLGVRVLAGRSEAAVPEPSRTPTPAVVGGGAPVESGTAPVEPGHGPTEPGTGPPEPGPAPTDGEREVSRRLFLSRSIALSAGVAAAGVGTYGITRSLAEPIVRRVPVQISGLDPSLAGFRIALFSDAHLGAIRRKPVMEQLVDLVNATEPDLVAVVGDLVDGSVAELGDDVAPMAGLQSVHGTYFVTGNHEYYSGAEQWVDYLPDLGVRVLANERVAIEGDGGAFDLAGVNDLTGGDIGEGPDFEAALGGRREERPVVLLSHQPVTVDKSVEHGVNLQLSGHTHGGQLWPFDAVIAVQQGAVDGLSRIGDTQMYVTAGAGSWGPPMRVGADPEIIVIELNPSRLLG